jgi:hypothetical protein
MPGVKFQKRTPKICVPPDQRDQIRQTPWGEMTYLDYWYRRRVRGQRLRADREVLRRAWAGLVRVAVGRAVSRFPRGVRRRDSQGGVRVCDGSGAVEATPRHRQADHPFDWNVDDRVDRPGSRRPGPRESHHPALDLGPIRCRQRTRSSWSGIRPNPRWRPSLINRPRFCGRQQTPAEPMNAPGG